MSIRELVTLAVGRNEEQQDDRVKYSDPQLPCADCAHSAASAPFPGFPSGERPCGFCIRNPGERFLMNDPKWYDGQTPPHKTPMDCYIATDRLVQQMIFYALDNAERYPDKVKPRQSLGKLNEDAMCCDGGPAPGGHTWTCIVFTGRSFT